MDGPLCGFSTLLPKLWELAPSFPFEFQAAFSSTSSTLNAARGQGKCEDIQSDYVEASVLDRDFEQWATEERLKKKLANTPQIIQKLATTETTLKQTEELLQLEKKVDNNNK